MHSASIIIPTSCRPARAALLRRAIESALSQSGVEVELIVVANGGNCDGALLQELRDDPRLKFRYIEQAGAPGACRYGRSLATTDYFAFLDDDDEYLPDTLAIRCAAMELHGAAVDLVVTNGYRGSLDVPYLRNIPGIARDPLSAMFEQNWLASCGGLFRTATCGDEFFADLPRYVEWTMLAYRLLIAGRVLRVIDTPTYRINDTPGSESKSREYRQASAGVIEQMLSLPLPWRIRRRLRQRLLAARHDLSVLYLQEGQMADAWKMHLQSLAGWSGLRYLSYTRRLLLRSP